MIDLKNLENSFDEVAKKLEKKSVDTSLLEKLKEISQELKQEKRVLEDLQSIQNAKSKLFPQYQKEGKDINELKEELAQNKQKIAIEQEKLRSIEDKLSSKYP